MKLQKLRELITGQEFKLDPKQSHIYRKLLYYGKSYDSALVNTEFVIDSNWNCYKFHEDTLVYVE